MGDTLLEWGYQDLWGQIDFQFIHMRDHYDAIQKLGVTYEGMSADDIVEFSTPSESRPGLRHHQLVQLVDLEKELANPQNRNIGDAVRAAMSGDLKIHCDCESWLMWGYQWMAINKDAALMPIAQGNPQTKYDGGDVRAHPPNIKNPGRRGSVCKHLGNVLKVFPFWWNTIAGELQERGFGPAPSTVEVPDEAPQEQPTAASSPERTQPKAKKKQAAPRRQRKVRDVPTFTDLAQQADEEPFPQPFQQRPKTKKKPKRKKQKYPKRRQPRPGEERPTFPGIGDSLQSFSSMVDTLLEEVG